jgi:hypothetical protein
VLRDDWAWCQGSEMGCVDGPRWGNNVCGVVQGQKPGAWNFATIAKGLVIVNSDGRKYLAQRRLGNA